jgi:hypothetical protein
MIAIHMERQSAGTKRYRDVPRLWRREVELENRKRWRGKWRTGEAEERMGTSASGDIKSDIRRVWTGRRWKLGKLRDEKLARKSRMSPEGALTTDALNASN